VQGYRPDLAYIHDAGYTGYVMNAAPGLLRILRKHGIRQGLVVDLGCGSGRWARELNQAGYEVLGIDQSPAMIRLARQIAPDSTFQVGSVLKTRLPECDAITAIGEVLNYCFDESNSRQTLKRLLKRAYRALRPGGVFVADLAGPGRHTGKAPGNHCSAGRDWALLSISTTDAKHSMVCRRITSFVKAGALYKRSEEVHYLRLYPAAQIAADLAQTGFRVRVLSGYGRMRFPKGISGVLAVKP
jgi:SAM-dependent methyltransferase